MRPKLLKRPVRVALMATVLLLGGFLLWMQAVFGGNLPMFQKVCQAEVTIQGQLLDEEGIPLAGEELHFSFYTSPQKQDQEEAVLTDQQGRFRFQTTVTQDSYWNSGRQTVELQARMFLDGHTRVVRYQPGGHQFMSDTGSVANWTQAGRYGSDAVPVFHSLRMNSLLNLNGDFADLTIELGTTDSPVTFQLEQSFAVMEQYVSQKGETLRQSKTTTGYAPGATFSGRPPDAVEKDGAVYTYEGYYENEPAYLLAGQPAAAITADTVYQYVYRQSGSDSSGNGGGSGGKDKDGGSGGGTGTDKESPGNPIDPDPPDGEGNLSTGESPGEEVMNPSGPEPEPNLEPEPREPADPSPEPAWPDEPDGPDAATNGTSPGHTTRTATTAGQMPPALSEEERQARRNITFIKWSYQQDVAPGEEITYGFAGFENDFPYSLREFSIVDEPDPGLDLVRLELPSFREGNGLTYDVRYSTNRQKEQILIQDCPADRAQTLAPPTLEPAEYITELYITFAEVPPDFGKNDELMMTFRVWAEPPAATLHNRAFLYYLEQGEQVALTSDGRQAQVTVDGEHTAIPTQYQTQTLVQTEDTFIHGGRKSLSKLLAVLLLILALLAGGYTVYEVRRQKRKT